MEESMRSLLQASRHGEPENIFPKGLRRLTKENHGLVSSDEFDLMAGEFLDYKKRSARAVMAIKHARCDSRTLRLDVAFICSDFFAQHGGNGFD